MALHLVTDIRNDGATIARTATEPRYLDACEVATVARKRLAVAFPGVKFSVTTSKYSGGSSLRVKWTDGPTVEMVDAVVGMLDGSTFDGMIDLKSSKGLQSIPEFDEPVRIGNDYIFTCRTLSAPFVEALRRRIERRYDMSTWHAYELDQMVYKLSGRATLVNGHLMIAKEQY